MFHRGGSRIFEGGGGGVQIRSTSKERGGGGGDRRGSNFGPNQNVKKPTSWHKRGVQTPLPPGSATVSVSYFEN